VTANPESTRPVVRAADESPTRRVDAGTAAEMQVLLGPGDGAPNFALRRFRMQTGGGMPRHVNEVEHEQFVLRGKARVGIGDEVHEVSSGDVLLIPAGTPHSYEVVEAPFEFLCIVPNRPDRIRVLKKD